MSMIFIMQIAGFYIIEIVNGRFEIIKIKIMKDQVRFRKERRRVTSSAQKQKHNHNEKRLGRCSTGKHTP
jgi:hypothetical protein